jgi:hypothetical protein
MLEMAFSGGRLALVFSGARNYRREMLASKSSGNAPSLIPYSVRIGQIGCPY